MRSTAVALACALVFTAAAPAHAEGFNNLFAGINCLANAPAEIPMHLYEPPEAFEDMPGVPVTNRVLGLFSGTLMTGHRLLMGTFDILFTPVWVFPTFSPEGYYEVIPNVEYVE